MKKNSGFSLVELMVALVIGLVLIAGVIELFTSTRQTYRIQDMKARMQEDGRYAMHHISTVISKAGYRGCSGNKPSKFDNLLRNQVGSYDLSNPVLGYEAIDQNNWLPALPGINNAVGGNDVLSVRTVNSTFIHITGHPNNPGAIQDAPIIIPANNSLEDCDPKTDNTCANIVMVSTCDKTVVFQVTNATPGTTGILEHEANVGIPGNTTNTLAETFTGGWVNTISSSTFYIRNDGDGTPSLFEETTFGDRRAIVEGVESMQLTFGVDTNGDSNIDNYVRANAVADWSTVVNVRIWLVMINIDPDPANNNNVALGNASYYLEDQVIIPPDGRLRRSFTQTISLRNALK
ncbi:MAG TPA: prepilin-type N-terminal cleavage/methylation domain-containing protein [Methylophaga aminisulfidivorans]|uniref:Prepilin-type N-terminal cleavage/methylation domain-containing protein n=1 Tax=Methylophaga aminisulfidivorans TaxID=230105 RepID=A0A7C1W0R7_9GAMM|nr:prepilin-type N-terminal cleavage/methylation domain-containing protein [Methylophaga aminisulfidivorans]